MAKLKQDLQNKEKLLAKQRTIFKEVKLMKDQWRASELLRQEQARQIVELQQQNQALLRQNLKLKAKLDQSDQPKVTIVRRVTADVCGDGLVSEHAPLRLRPVSQHGSRQQLF